MAINKVKYGGNTLIDLTSDSVTPESLLSGVTAHDKSGNPITGTFDPDKYLEKTGDASDTTVTFVQATNRANISSKEKFSVIMGKIAKFFADLKTVAFTGEYSDLSGTPGVVSKTANGLCPKNGGTKTKFLRDDGTYAEPTASVSGLSTLEQVTAAATAGNVTDPVGAGAVNELNSSLKNENNESFNFGVKDGVRGFYTNPSRADDSFIPFKSSDPLIFDGRIIILADDRGPILKTNKFYLWSVGNYGAFSVNVKDHSKVHVIVNARASLLKTYFLGTSSKDAISGTTLASIAESTSDDRYRDFTLDVSEYDWFCIYCPYFIPSEHDYAQRVFIDKLELL